MAEYTYRALDNTGQSRVGVMEADNEAQFVAILAHEMSHEIHNDYAFFWHAAKVGGDSYGRGGLLGGGCAVHAGRSHAVASARASRATGRSRISQCTAAANAPSPTQIHHIRP